MKMGIPAIIHEQNAYPGVTNKMLSGGAARVMLAVSDAQKHLNPNARCVLTATPSAPTFCGRTGRVPATSWDVDGRPLILSFGGSLGARKVNEAVADLLTHTIPHRAVPAHSRLRPVQPLDARFAAGKGD